MRFLQYQYYLERETFILFILHHRCEMSYVSHTQKLLMSKLFILFLLLITQQFYLSHEYSHINSNVTISYVM